MKQRKNRLYAIALVTLAAAALCFSERARTLALAGLSAPGWTALIVLLPLMLLQPALPLMASASFGLLMLFVFFHLAGRKETASGDMSSRPPKLAYDATIATVAITALAALWMGEHHGDFVISQHDANAALIPPAFIILLLWRAGRSKAIRAAIGIYMLFLLIWFAGSKEANLAFNDCVQHGETVRIELAKYQSRHGRYPESLDHLGMRLPGKLVFPPHLFRYERTSSGYQLSFSDFMIIHAATESEEFIGHK